MSEGIVVVGAGGHAKVCVEILRSMGHKVAACIAGDDSISQLLDIPVVAGDHHLDGFLDRGHTEVFVAIGANETRQRLADRLLQQGFDLVSAVSPFASISPSARIGAGVAIMPGAVVNADTEIGDLAIINTGATVDHDCVIGRAAHLAPQTGLAGNVRVGAGSFLGVGCSVIPGVSIGDRVTIGAGAVVVSDLPDDTRARGVPARAV